MEAANNHYFLQISHIKNSCVNVKEDVAGDESHMKFLDRHR